jgi:oligopeptidase B
MKRIVISLFLISLLFAGCSDRGKVAPPIAEKIPYELTDHGDTRIDNYYWMRLSDEQKSAETPDEQTSKVLSYLNAENAYLESVMEDTEELQEKLFNEMVGRIKQDDESVPALENGYYYYSRYLEGKEYPLYYRKKDAPDAEEELLVDVNVLAEGKNYCSVTSPRISMDNKIMAYGVDYVSRRRYDIHFVNLETGEKFDDILSNTTGSVVWAPDNQTLFYTGKDYETLRSDRIMRHRLGDSQEGDETVFFESDEEFSTGIYLTTSKKYFVIFSSQTLSTEARILRADNPGGDFEVFNPREADHEYSVDHIGNSFYVMTNMDEARNFKLMRVPERSTQKDNWSEFIPHREDVLLQGFTLFNDYLVLSERMNALNNIRVMSYSGTSDYYIDFGEEVYTASPGDNREPDSKILRYNYTSLTTPSSVIDFNMETKDKTIMKEVEVLGDFDKENYKSERVWVTAADGTRVPVSMVYRKGFEKDGTAPLLLYAYGSYGYSTDPSFNSGVLSLLDRGFVYAIAHVRGGSEMGREWYEDGKLLKKINTFTDFNDCAQYLVDNNYTATDLLFARGGSAGGLLMGAIVNMRPDLYRGVVAGVPFVDVVTTMLDPTIPLTTFEWDEWGDPREKVYYDYMLSYSPYDQVKEMDYPNILVTTGYWDSQVQYWEPAKWVAKLRDMKTDDNILIMKCNMDAGHGGASGRFERLRTTALEYAFMLDLAGIKE